jgi:transposase
MVNITPKPWPFGSDRTYRQTRRNLIGRPFNKIKCFGRLAMRCDKLGSGFLVMLKLAVIRLWLRHNESSA